MDVVQKIDSYLQTLPEQKRRDMGALHQAIVGQFPDRVLTYHDGKDELGKVVSNPNIGYGTQRLPYADGSEREFYQIGLSATTSGISLYIMGLKDKNYLRETFGSFLGKATVTSYCIKFRNLGEVDLGVLLRAVGEGIRLTSA